MDLLPIIAKLLYVKDHSGLITLALRKCSTVRNRVVIEPLNCEDAVLNKVNIFTLGLRRCCTLRNKVPLAGEDATLNKMGFLPLAAENVAHSKVDYVPLASEDAALNKVNLVPSTCEDSVR